MNDLEKINCDIGDIGFSERTRGRLRGIGVDKLSDIRDITEVELLRRGLGKASLNELKDIIIMFELDGYFNMFPVKKTAPEIIHISIDGIFTGWKHSCEWVHEDVIGECSVGRITNWGGHYICVIHDDVPESEREEVAKFIAAAPETAKNLKALTDLTGALLKDIMPQIGKLAIRDYGQLNELNILVRKLGGFEHGA